MNHEAQISQNFQNLLAILFFSNNGKILILKRKKYSNLRTKIMKILGV